MGKPQRLIAVFRTNKTVISILVIAAALACIFIPSRWYDGISFVIGNSFLSFTVGVIAAELICVIPAIIALFLIHKPQNIIGSMGLNGRFAFACLFGFLASIPMLASNFFADKIILGDGWFCSAIEYTSIYTIYQFLIVGFLFGQLFRYAGWGFTPVILLYAFIIVVPAIVFNSNSILDVPLFVQDRSITLLIYAFYFWLYVEWKYNIWIPVCLAFFMSIPTEVLITYTDFEISDWIYYAALLLTATAAVATTVVHKKRNKMPFTITAHNLLINKQTEAC